MEVRPVGELAVLLCPTSSDQVAAIARRARRTWQQDLGDVVPGHETVLLRFASSVPSDSELATVLASDAPEPGQAEAVPLQIPVVYDGDDLKGVAALAGISPEEVVRRHEAGEYTAAFCGFMPGFAYLVGGDPILEVPRRDAPRTTVTAGSVALAGPYTAVYPRDSPGGWQLIGRTELVLFDPGSDAPALITPGMQVRFIEAGHR